MKDDFSSSFTPDYPLSEVPADQRRSFYRMSMVWVGWCISLSAFLVGGIIGGGTSAGTGLQAVLYGNLVLVVVASLVGLIGYRTGLTTYSVSRIVFGNKGSVITSLLIGILAMGFVGALLKAFGNAFHAMVPSVSVTLSIVVFTVLVTLTAIYGFRGLAILSIVSAPALWIFLALGLVLAVREAGGLGAVFAKTPDEPISFFAAMNAAIAVWITGSTMVCDITRYARKAWHVVAGAFIGYVCGAAVFEGASVLTAIGVGDPNIVGVMGSLGLLIPGVIILALSLWTTTDNNVYSSSLAFTNFGEIVGLELSKPVWVLICAAIALGTALSGMVDKFITMLLFIATFLPPFAGILIAHFWIVNRRAATAAGDVGRHDIRYTAFASWIAAILIARFGPWDAVALVGLISSIVIYTVLELSMRSASPQRSET